MLKNSAPLFFLIIISSTFYAAALFLKEDILTYANKAKETLTESKDYNLAQSDSTEVGLVSDAIKNEHSDVLETEEPTTIEEPKELAFHKVLEPYFDDALFIGDSRTDGLKKYASLGNASFYCETGMTIHNIFNRKLQEDTISEEKLSLEEVLTKKSYKKIYLMVGINELGRGTADTYFEEYKKVISRIQTLQPDAYVFIEGNMNVTKEKSDNDPIFNNKNIADRNEKIASLADKKTIFYIDINEVITDEEGNLIAEYTFDNIHLKAKYYSIWKEFLLDHGI